MKKYITITIIIILTLITANSVGKLYFYGDQIERDKIIEATVWKLQEDGYNKDDIVNINSSYNPLKGGVLPYTALVTFKANESRIQIYAWTDIYKT